MNVYHTTLSCMVIFHVCDRRRQKHLARFFFGARWEKRAENWNRTNHFEIMALWVVVPNVASVSFEWNLAKSFLVERSSTSVDMVMQKYMYVDLWIMPLISFDRNALLLLSSQIPPAIIICMYRIRFANSAFIGRSLFNSVRIWSELTVESNRIYIKWH